MSWRPIEEYKFPWEPSRIIVLAHAKDDPNEVEAFVCTCADGGNLYHIPFIEKPSGCPLALDEKGWVALMWTPAPDFLAEKLIPLKINPDSV